MKPESCYWDEKTPKLVGNKLQKVRLYLRDRLIVNMGNGVFEIDPTPGRHQKHIVDSKLFTCTCQNYNTGGLDCSHVMATKLFLQQVAEGTRDIDEGHKRRQDGVQEVHG